MSHMGQIRTSSDLDVMSAVLLITDSTRTSFNVAAGPTADMALPWQGECHERIVARPIRNERAFAQGCALSVFGIGDFSRLYGHYCGENATDNDVRCA